jgi:hypothetical protein
MMVGRSAQPHSVDDMVGRCFNADEEGEGEGERGRRDHLVVIWATDIHGLTEGE